MGLFSRLKKEKMAEVINYEPFPEKLAAEGRRPVILNSQADRLGYLRDNCEIVVDCTRKIDEMKVEYQAVTSYLTDMQRIDMIPIEQRENMEDAARKIINLTKERNKFQTKRQGLTDKQYRLFEQYEKQIPKELNLIKESEAYQLKIEKDMAYLEKEKQELIKEQEEIVAKQGFLKGIAITVCCIIILLFAIFTALSFHTESKLTLPFLLTVCLGMILAVYIFFEARKNSQNSKLVQKKQGKEVYLMNKVKIKSVNNRSYLEYTYSKYMVENYQQFKKLWEEYIRIKDETRRYQNNTELLEYYNNELINELKKFGVSDSEIWIYQPSAILDNREMVEVRHRLNVRRQKLRERIELNTKQKEDAMQALNVSIMANPECREEAMALLHQYRITLNA